MRYFLHLAYDGTPYHGWQVQPNTLTVQAEVDRCLSQVLRQPIHCLGSGRTDTGVHASHQVAHFEAELPEGLSLDVLLYRLRRALPPDIAALRLHPVAATAHVTYMDWFKGFNRDGVWGTELQKARTAQRGRPIIPSVPSESPGIPQEFKLAIEKPLIQIDTQVSLNT